MVLVVLKFSIIIIHSLSPETKDVVKHIQSLSGLIEEITIFMEIAVMKRKIHRAKVV